MRHALLSILLILALPVSGCVLTESTNEKMGDAATAVQGASDALTSTLDKAEKVVSALEEQVGRTIPEETSEAAASGLSRTAAVARGVQTGAAIVKTAVPPAAPIAGAIELIAMAIATGSAGLAEFFRRRKAAAEMAKAAAEAAKANTEIALSVVTRTVETLPDSAQDTIKEAVKGAASMAGVADIVKAEISAAKG